ncbi:MAG: ribokinase [Phycisphaeraceae bacterium]|nr:ribokinase [Phycisphaeraceae bacterium]
MGILNFGSLNIDAVYRVPHIVGPGETLGSVSFATFAGGKGANQSMALARAGATVAHGGKVGPDGRWLKEKLRTAGVNVKHLLEVNEPNGQAIIQVDDRGQNSIILFAGTNKQITREQIDRTLVDFGRDDWLLLQNEINEVTYLMEKGQARGMKICFNPAPFDDQVLGYPLDLVSLLILNETEAKGLVGEAHLSCDAKNHQLAQRVRSKFPRARIVLTCGEKGAIYCHTMDFAPGPDWIYAPAAAVTAADTTGAGDTFIGYFLAMLADGKTPQEALGIAQKAAAICVTRPGAMDSIPTRREVDEFPF